MAHLTSSSALHTARVILKNFDLEPRPPETLSSGRLDNLKADERCVAILVDYATNVFELAKIRPEIRYWQKSLHAGTTTAPQIANFFSKMLTAFDLIPKDAQQENVITTTFEVPREFTGVKPVVNILSKPARQVARFVFYYFVVNPKNGKQDEKLDFHRVATLAEVSLGLSRTMKIVPYLRKTYEDLKEGKATVGEIRKCLREVGVHFEYLPTYENREEEVRILY